MITPPPDRTSRTMVYVDGFNLFYGALKEPRTSGSIWPLSVG